MKKFLPSLLLIAACRAAEPAPDYSRELAPGQMALRKITDPRRLPDFSGGFANREGLASAIDRSLAYMSKPSSRQYYPYLDVTHERAVHSLKAFKELLATAASGQELHHRVIEMFDVYESVGWNGSGAVLFTAYCEPIYEGSLSRVGAYRHPLYRLPPDLLKEPDGKPLGRRTSSGEITSYYTRREIDESGRLTGLELVYLKDPVEAYIIHVQGSARIRLPDGREMRIGYAGKTDRPYTSIGKEMIKDGRFPRSELSLQRIKRHFGEHPEQILGYLYRNESYVFFTERQGGPYGSLNVPLTPLRSIATDKAVFPRAAIAYAVADLPQSSLRPEPFRSFLLDQDTGGAIRSAGRADIYYGSGPDAESKAGHTQNEGRLYYVFLKE
jgi:membrane-bound lytic murein transglycosylase A